MIAPLFNNSNMITTPAGYISGSMRYYYLKDYQGNNCVVLNQNGVVQQINHYYPYGLFDGRGVRKMIEKTSEFRG